MSAPIKTITTPFGKQKVGLKEWITGADREYIDGSVYTSIDATPQMHGKTMNMQMKKLDMEALSNNASRRAIEKFVVSVDDQTENLVDVVMNMHEDDTAFILEAIDESSKKKAKTESI